MQSGHRKYVLRARGVDLNNLSGQSNKDKDKEDDKKIDAGLDELISAAEESLRISSCRSSYAREHILVLLSVYDHFDKKIKRLQDAIAELEAKKLKGAKPNKPKTSAPKGSKTSLGAKLQAAGV